MRTFDVWYIAHRSHLLESAPIAAATGVTFDARIAVFGAEVVSAAGPTCRYWFQAAAANLNPWTEAKVDTENPERGPLLITSGQKDNTVPWSIANASFKQQQKNTSVTEIVEIPNRGHALTIDSGWREVADTALKFIRRFIPA